MITYKHSLEKIMSIPMFQNVGAAAFIPTLDNIIKLSDHFGNPHNCYKTIHVAGTNGKGSTSSMLASVLREAGYKVGLYTSPHLSDYRERVRINGEKVSEQLVCEFMEHLGERIDEWKPSFFEVTTALAFFAFRQEQVDIAVIEVGLGGRTDSTNIITPILSIITNIGVDHKNILGDTLTDIAYQKGGILKRDVAAVIGQRGVDSDLVFDNIAAEVGASLSYAEDIFSVTSSDEMNRNVFVKTIATNEPSNCYHLDLGGDYQHKNLVTLLTAVELLRKKNIVIDNDSLLRGLSSVVANSALYGRWQVVGDSPLTVCDTGHNADGLEYVTGQLKRVAADKKYIVLGFMADKDVESILPFFPKDAFFLFATVSNARSMRGDELKHRAEKYGLQGDWFSSVGEAYHRAKALANSTDMIFIGGSTFVVADFFASLDKYTD